MERLDHPTPLKIQKTMYLLWAFYAATYGDIIMERGLNLHLNILNSYLMVNSSHKNVIPF